MVVTARHPLLSAYPIRTVPEERPFTMPDDEPMEAIAGLLLDQTPPDVAFVSVVVAPMHIAVGPAIAAGEGITVTTTVAIQPVARL